MLHILIIKVVFLFQELTWQQHGYQWWTLIAYNDDNDDDDHYYYSGQYWNSKAEQKRTDIQRE